MKTSVVMAAHGNWPVVERAVAALRPQLGPDRELVLADDASPTPPPDGFPGTIIRNEENLGFGPSCNRGAAVARGRFLLFLNSDSLVEPGAVEALEAAAERHESAVAGVLLDEEDGRLQEAGSAVGRDGIVYPLGRGAEPSDPQWAFTREVDFASAACLLVPREWFEELGGFDDRYAPGYYEDADLCLRLTERGQRTVIEPAAQVVHLQYGSGSRERAIELVRRNRVTFLERWGERFAHRPIVVAAHPWPHRELALRDAIPLLRFLVLAQAQLADDVARRWPGARVTLVGDGSRVEGIEEASPDDLHQWLEDRRFHYTAVLGAESDLDDLLRRTQPQAARDLGDPVIPPPGEEPRG